MSQQPYSDPSYPITILFEAVPEDEQNPDPAAIEAAGHEVISALRADGYTVTSVYTGQRGGGLYEILPAVQYVMTNADQIAALLKPIVRRVAEVREKHLELATKEADGIKIEFSLSKEQAQFKGESPNLVGNELLAELARELMDLHVQIAEQEAPRIVEQDVPGSVGSVGSVGNVVKIIERVPKRKPRRRR